MNVPMNSVPMYAPIYEGKAKKVFPTEKPGVVKVEFKDSLTAFNAQKTGQFEKKGAVNRDIAALIFKYLKQNGIPNHWIENQGEREMLVEQVKIIPIEVVTRNVLAGSTAKKLGLEEGKHLAQPLIEFYLKNDQLGDPFLSDDQIFMLELADASDLKNMREQALKINEVLKKLFGSINIQLIDFKIELGKKEDGTIILADEITPDTCRLWDMKTQMKLDKDRFRRDLGNVSEAYNEVLNRLTERLKTI